MGEGRRFYHCCFAVANADIECGRDSGREWEKPSSAYPISSGCNGGSEEAGDKKNGRTDMAAAARASGSGSPHSALDISGNVIDVFDVSFL